VEPKVVIGPNAHAYVYDVVKSTVIKNQREFQKGELQV
jgi:hypothetical protein